MLLGFRIALLAALAIGLLVLFGVFGESAQHVTKSGQVRGGGYGTSPADAASALSKLRVPPGFRRAGCKEREQAYIACFERPRSLVLEDSAVKREIAAMGLKLRVEAKDAVTCSRGERASPTRLVLQFCTADTMLGGERLLIFIKSVVLAGTRSVLSDTRGAGSIPGGSEVRVGVIGHPLT